MIQEAPSNNEPPEVNGKSVEFCTDCHLAFVVLENSLVVEVIVQFCESHKWALGQFMARFSGIPMYDRKAAFKVPVTANV